MEEKTYKVVKVFALRNIVKSLEMALYDMEVLINATPTSEDRNQLTDANIHIAEALRVAELMKDKA